MKTHHQLVLICGRLQSLSEVPLGQIATAGPACRQEAEALALQLVHIADAVDELINHCQALSDQFPAQSYTQQLTELRDYTEQCRTLSLSMKLLTNSFCDGWAYLTKGMLL